MAVQQSWLLTVVIVEGLLIGRLVLQMFAITVLRSSRATMRKGTEARWQASMIPALERGGTAEVDGLEAMSVRRQVAAMTKLGGPLSGEMTRNLVNGSGYADIVRTAQTWCRSRTWWRRLQGIRTLTLLKHPPGEQLSLLHDKNAEVRAEAAAWVSLAPTTDSITTLISMLDKDEKRCRFAAEDSLRRIKEPAVGALITYLAGPARQAEIALRVATESAGSSLIPTALNRCADSEPRTRAASAGLLAAIGGERAAAPLLELLSDTDPRVRAAAARGLGDIEHWAAAPVLFLGLSDLDWEVRRSTAVALRALGPAGRLYLRRAQSGGDTPDAEIARYVLDLPAAALDVRPR